MLKLIIFQWKSKIIKDIMKNQIIQKQNQILEASHLSIQIKTICNKNL